MNGGAPSCLSGLSSPPPGTPALAVRFRSISACTPVARSKSAAVARSRASILSAISFSRRALAAAASSSSRPRRSSSSRFRRVVDVDFDVVTEGGAAGGGSVTTEGAGAGDPGAAAGGAGF